MDKLKSMLKSEKNSVIERYYITKTSEFEHVINSGISLASRKNKKNIAYSLRYLEFLTLQLDELVLDDLMKKLIWKNFIITGGSILEVIMQEKIVSDKIGEELLKDFRKKNPLELSGEELRKLDRFRKLRNKVHLKIKYDDDDTDWFKFEETDYKEFKQLLYAILTNDKMCNKEYHRYINFLK